MASVDISSITEAYSNYESDYNDTSVRRTQTIHGRTKETLALLKMYERLLATKEAQTVIVHGESGSGKTALVNILRDPVFDTNGYFVTGKYFQRDATVQEPYSAITAALSDLCDLVVQSSDFDEHLQEKIANELGSDVQLLANSISNISSLVGESVMREIAIDLTFPKFKIACKHFLHAMSSTNHPIVIFLDDVQWSDEGSMQLIQMFLQDPELRNVMFVLVYRDEDSAQVLESGMLVNIRCPTDIALHNLDAGVVHQIVTYILGSTSDDIRKLSDLVAKRTRGNPLHVKAFMQTVQRYGLLIYDSEAGSWLFDLDKIQQEVMVSETLAGLLTRKVERLPDHFKSTLKIASILGYQFSESVLRNVISSAIEDRNQRLDPGSVDLSLSEAVKEGFVEKTSDGYQFTHDKLQSAFRCLISETEEARLHFLIGNTFLLLEDDKSSIYRAAVHLNCAPGFLCNHQQRAILARINLKAARYCMEMSAFKKAVVALRNGLKVLRPVKQWSDPYFCLTFEIMETLARTQFIVGDFEACKETTREALSHGKTAEMNIKLLLIGVEVRMASNEVNSAIVTANRALNGLGFKMPRKAKLRHVLAKLMKVKFMLRHKTDNDLLNLPLAQDVLAENAVKLLMHICSYCLLKEETDTAIFSALMATELTLKNGLSRHSPCAFVIYGVAEVSLGHIKQADRFAKLSLAMLDRMDSKEAECPTVSYAHTIIRFRKEQLGELIGPLHQVANSGFQHGDSIYGVYCATQCYAMHVHIGTHFANLESEMRVTYDKVRDLGQDALLRWLEPSLQYVVTMQANITDWEHIAVLTGEVMNEEQYIKQANETNHAVFVLLCSLWKAKLAVEFGQLLLACSILDNCSDEAIQFSWSAPAYYLDQALANFGLFKSSGQRRHLKKGRKYKRLLQRMHAAGCPAAIPLFVFLVAQETLCSKKYVKNSTLRESYDRGINKLVELKDTVHLEGLLNERAGFDFARRGQRTEAESYFERALHIYQHDWGAIAKVNQLKHTSLEALKKRVGDGNIKGLTVTCLSGQSEDPEGAL